MDIACVSTGIGTTSAEICLHELKNIGAHTTVRIAPQAQPRNGFSRVTLSSLWLPSEQMVPAIAMWTSHSPLLPIVWS